MDYRKFLNVDLEAWVYGTIKRHRHGLSWQDAWLQTYRRLGGKSESSGRKGCPMVATNTLYQFGRLKNAGMPFRECDIPELWQGSRNGTYAMLALRLLRADPELGKARLWREIQKAVRSETGDGPARTNQGGPTVSFKLWHLGLIVDGNP